MLKKLGLPVLALGTMLALFTPQAAQAKVHFGVYFGTPAYTYPVPANPYGYLDPYTYSYPYGYAYGPTYVWGGGHDRQEHRDRDNHSLFNRGQNFRGNDHGGGHDRGRSGGDHHGRH